MTVQCVDPVDLLIDDLGAAIAFLVELALKLEGRCPAPARAP